MAVYGNMVLTQRGQALYSKVQAGATLTFTRMQIGSGQLQSGQDPTTFTALISPIDWVTINSVTSSGGTALVRGIYQNTNLTQSTYTCEIGLFAQDPDLGEILYAYANAGTQGDTFPPYADGPFARNFQINIAVGNATNVTATVPDGTYVTVAEVGAPNGVAPLGPDGQIPANYLQHAPNPGGATPTTAGLVKTTGTSGVAVTNDDPVYTHAARTDQANTFTAKQTFSGGFDLPAGQSGTVEGTLSAGTGGTIHATNSDNLGGNPPSYYLPATAQAADSAKLGGKTPSYYLPATAQAADSAKLGGQPPSYYAPISSPNFSGTPQAGGKNLLQAISGGYKVQSGITSYSSASSGTITFPTPFTSTPIVVACSDAGNNASSAIAVTSVSTASFSWTENYGGKNTIYWVAIGS
ncbi:H-type lectin domain-containing protein [Alicyclobacillus macrosporangiidus]|uniref:Putative tail fiber protein gp53-like C-terminal domain-containing protein n=1 Tax=Alicyclobacillus macrosporangiidus TaxID=392015 RepID=A0A1I7IER9_9BACL|nr:H-type lectin domain-containing protein [Alicyclobacillus macrosporangiidus]SFU71350.1 hypothetical protein SAMN05421543_106173 [Alicyclobacillus macrosporangiidus]